MAKKRILIFAHYYAPDTASTGQILKDQAEGMLEEFEVTVICVVPSYNGEVDERYKTQKYYFEELNGVKIIRVRVPGFNKTNKKSRIKNIVSYFWGALGASRKAGKQDYVFTISQPPILGGILGVLGKWQKKAKMIYCIQDFNPEQVMAVNYSTNKLVLNLMMAIDKFSCRHSDLVVTVGRDLAETLKSRFSNRNVPNYVVINNWIDQKEVFPLSKDDEGVEIFKKEYGLENKFVIMYSGNIGLYYDLENIIKVIEKFKPGTTNCEGKEVCFAFVGDGTVLNKLKKYKEEHNMSNVVFIPYQTKENLKYSLNSGDVHWCVNSKGIKGVSCPSKAYGIMGAGKPIIGVLEQDSEIRIIIEEANNGICCDPGDYSGLEYLIDTYIYRMSQKELTNMGDRGYQYLTQNLSMDMSIRRYREEILRL